MKVRLLHPVPAARRRCRARPPCGHGSLTTWITQARPLPRAAPIVMTKSGSPVGGPLACRCSSKVELAAVNRLTVVRSHPPTPGPASRLLLPPWFNGENTCPVSRLSRFDPGWGLSCAVRPVHLAVRISVFQSERRGSTPLRATKRHAWVMSKSGDCAGLKTPRTRFDPEVTHRNSFDHHVDVARLGRGQVVTLRRRVRFPYVQLGSQRITWAFLIW